MGGRGSPVQSLDHCDIYYVKSGTFTCLITSSDDCHTSYWPLGGRRDNRNCVIELLFDFMFKNINNVCISLFCLLFCGCITLNPITLYIIIQLAK